jgi:hypothetical protein
MLRGTSLTAQEPCLDETGAIPVKKHGGAREGKRWTPEEDKLCTELWDQGIWASKIAAQLNRTPSSVRSRIANLGCQPRQQSANQMRRLSHIFGEEGSIEWYECQQEAFCKAMLENPDERPTDIPEAQRGHVNFVGRITPRRIQPSWSSMGDIDPGTGHGGWVSRGYR